MEQILIPPAEAAVFGIPAWILAVPIPLVGLAAFAFIMAKRLIPRRKGTPNTSLN